MDTMSKLHCLVFVVVLCGLIAAFFIASLQTDNMLYFENGHAVACTDYFQHTSYVSNSSFVEEFLDCSNSTEEEGMYWVTFLLRVDWKSRKHLFKELVHLHLWIHHQVHS